MSSQEQTSYTLEELARESGIETRVIRSFIENGLIRGPGKLGRYARYSRHHLNRLLAIRVMKERQGLRLSEVRQQLLFMSEAEINALAETGFLEAEHGDQAPGSALDYIRAHNQVFFNQNNARCASIRPHELDFDSHEDDNLELLYESSAQENDDELKQSHLNLAESIRAKLDEMAQTSKPGGPSAERGQRLTGWGPRVPDPGTEPLETKPVDRLIEGLRLLVGEKPVRKQSKSEQWHHIQITPDIELSVRGVPDDEQVAHLERVADYLRELLTGAGYE